jgi:hypothetical protein
MGGLAQKQGFYVVEDCLGNLSIRKLISSVGSETGSGILRCTI